MLNCFFDTSQSNKIYHKQQQEYEGKTKTYIEVKREDGMKKSDSGPVNFPSVFRGCKKTSEGY
ncbi:unnamed protein product [Tenebrio molitor]|nr:unnamed protein product [Tenebrio molitor]